MLNGIENLFSILMEYETLRCFLRIDGGMKHFCVSLNLYGCMKHFGVSFFQMGEVYEIFWRFLGPNGGMKHFTVFPGKGGPKHFLKVTAGVRNILNFSHRGYETFPG